ncbi:hypothetical protein [Niabella sp.]|uniref:hypothetical protein n=1 Tax=Niabella sp. TaxID=1962976 RepID=UPI00261C1B7C|nr:hypothetical protein [Niabella sp.]
MAEIKRRTIIFTTGKQVRLFGNSIGIGKTLEIGQVYMPDILSHSLESGGDLNGPSVHNPNKLTTEEVMELADLMMQYWLQLKDNIRKFGIENPKIFIRDASK